MAGPIYVILGVVVCLLAGRSHATQTVISDADMVTYMKSNRSGLAQLNAPVWFFGQAMNDPPCLPTWAFGSRQGPDTYDANHHTKGVARCQHTWFERPGIGCGCRNPGPPIGNPSAAFPVYYTVRQCNETQITVAHNLFYEKDGFKIFIPTLSEIPTEKAYEDAGHDYDFERALIVYTKSGSGSSATWAASYLLLSFHSGLSPYSWNSIQNTLTSEQARGPDPRFPQGQKMEDHPKVYVGWAKHANFIDKNTGWNDPVSQLASTAFRSDDWWHLVKPENYIEASDGTPAGSAFHTVDWGDAYSDPPRVHGSMCSAEVVTTPFRGLHLLEDTPDPALEDTSNGNFSLAGLPANLTASVPSSVLSEVQTNGTSNGTSNAPTTNNTQAHGGLLLPNVPTGKGG